VLVGAAEHRRRDGGAGSHEASRPLRRLPSDLRRLRLPRRRRRAYVRAGAAQEVAAAGAQLRRGHRCFQEHAEPGRRRPPARPFATRREAAASPPPRPRAALLSRQRPPATAGEARRRPPPPLRCPSQQVSQVSVMASAILGCFYWTAQFWHRCKMHRTTFSPFLVAEMSCNRRLIDVSIRV
jgi:hypothetical protein